MDEWKRFIKSDIAKSITMMRIASNADAANCPVPKLNFITNLFRKKTKKILTFVFLFIPGAYIINTAFAVVEENETLKQQVSVFQEQFKPTTLILPQSYIEKEVIINADFKETLPKINLSISDKYYSCTPLLEMPPTLVDSWEPCYAPNIQAQLNKDQAIENLAKKLMDGFIKAEEENFVRFGNNQYTVIPKNI